MSTTGSDRPRGVDVRGPGDATPLLFVHGTVFNRTMWAPQRDALTTEYRVLTPDLPGHGTRADERFTLDGGIETLEHVVDSVDERSLHVVGLSLGGYVATEFARRHPDAVDDLVVSGASSNPVGLLGTVTRLLGRVTLAASRSDLVERATDWLATRYVRSREIRAEQKAEIVRSGFDLEPFGRAGIEIADTDFHTAFAAFPGPALVLNGQFDVLMRRGEDAHAAAGDASVTVIDGAGHTCNLDEPEKYTDAIRRFVTATAETPADD